ncbi:MAG: hypothetical protein ACLFPQ_00300 [Candidatus Woesearchaeota archaeon]
MKEHKKIHDFSSTDIIIFFSFMFVFTGFFIYLAFSNNLSHEDNITGLSLAEKSKCQRAAEELYGPDVEGVERNGVCYVKFKGSNHFMCCAYVDKGNSTKSWKDAYFKK